jgi:hypothetical protein
VKFVSIIQINAEPMLPFDTNDKLTAAKQESKPPAKPAEVRQGINRFVLFSHEPCEEVAKKPKGELSGKIICTSSRLTNQ